MEPLPPGDEEENLTVPGEEVEPEPPGSEQPPGDEDTAAAAAVDPTASVAGYGYPYAGYGAQYADPSYDYQAYYNSYYYPQGQGYGAQPPSSAGQTRPAAVSAFWLCDSVLAAATRRKAGSSSALQDQ